jgi:unsaturated pyranuronate lyase
MSNLEHLQSLPPKGIWEGVAARVAEAERISMAVVELEPGGAVPSHQHHHEQLGLLLEGQLSFTVGDEIMELGPGGTWRIPGDVPHEVKDGPDGAVAVDVFTPARADWSELEPEAARPPRWPA